MTEGWHSDDYLVLFEEEASHMTKLYDLQQYLPGYAVVGLRGWDDFIVADEKQHLFTLPTVPLEPKHLKPFSTSIDRTKIKHDSRFQKKVKWYVKPIVFGGDPESSENIKWISYPVHAEAVRAWNKIYRDVAPNVPKD